MRQKFLLCGSLGLCMEVIWTGLHSFLSRDFHLWGHSSIWMFPIYGMAACIYPISNRLKGKGCPILFRGVIYTLSIFLIEYVTGFVLTQGNICPWDYSKDPTNISGLIRLDYAPLWFLAGLFFEQILSKADYKKVSSSP